MCARIITGTLKKRCEVYKSCPFCEWIVECFDYFPQNEEFYKNAHDDDNWILEFFKYFLESQEFYKNARDDDNWDP